MAARRAVEMVDHDPEWSKQFGDERAKLAGALPSALQIEHIGSTSVPGLVAKPIIDILVVVTDVAGLAADPVALTRLGYTFRPLAFPDDAGHLFFRKETCGRRTHHLHIFAADSPHPDDNLLFRDFLRANEDAARRYARAKTTLAAQHPDSRGEYALAKEPFVDVLMNEARRWQAQQHVVSPGRCRTRPSTS